MFSNIVRVISTRIDDLLRRRIKVIIHGSDHTNEVFESMPFGEDGVPAGEDLRAVYINTSKRGRPVLLGYVNMNQLSTLMPGEKRIYSTNEAGSAVSSFVIFKNDGTLEVMGTGDFLVRYNELETAFNQLQADHDALVQTFNNHVHGGVIVAVSGGSGGPAIGTPGNSAATGTTESPSTADITPAKIDEIKTTPSP